MSFTAHVVLRFTFAAIAVAVLLVSGGVVSADPALTGTWSGTYSETVGCGGTPVTNSGQIRLVVAPTPDTSILGIVEIEIVERTPQCQVRERVTTPLALSGSISGTAVSVRFEGNGWETGGPGSGTVSGTTMSLTGSQWQATLTRTSQSPPDTRFAGTFSGSYSATLVLCGGPQTQAYSGAFRITLFHAGQYAAGFITVSNSINDDCKPGEPPRTIPDPTAKYFFVAEAAGNTLDGFIWDGEQEELDPGGSQDQDQPFSATLDNLTLSGGGGTFSFTASRVSTTPSPVVLNLAADPGSVSRGSAATLRWDLFNAVSVTIDQGIGVQPSVGTVTVHPTATTDYLLTATGHDGTLTTETITLEVSGASRRRTVRH